MGGGGGQAAQRQLHPKGQAAQGGGQDTGVSSPLGGKLPRVQDKPVHRYNHSHDIIISIKQVFSNTVTSPGIDGTEVEVNQMWMGLITHPVEP